MLTLPEIIEKEAVPFVAIRRKVSLPFDDEVPRILAELFAGLDAIGVAAAGPVSFRHNIVVMPELDMDFGVPVARPVDRHAAEAAGLIAGELPAGRYAETTYFGHYDNLIAVNGILIDWARYAGHRFDSVVKPDGEHFACRLETYHNSPEEEPDPAKWKTSVSIKLAD